MLIEFQRAMTTPDRFGEGEGEEGDTPVASFISINPDFVAAVFGSSREPDTLIIRMSDGRGFKVTGTYQDAVQRLQQHAPRAATAAL